MRLLALSLNSRLGTRQSPSIRLPQDVVHMHALLKIIQLNIIIMSQEAIMETVIQPDLSRDEHDLPLQSIQDARQHFP